MEDILFYIYYGLMLVFMVMIMAMAVMVIMIVMMDGAYCTRIAAASCAHRKCFKIPAGT